MLPQRPYFPVGALRRRGRLSRARPATFSDAADRRGDRRGRAAGSGRAARRARALEPDAVARRAAAAWAWRARCCTRRTTCSSTRPPPRSTNPRKRRCTAAGGEAAGDHHRVDRPSLDAGGLPPAQCRARPRRRSVRAAGRRRQREAVKDRACRQRRRPRSRSRRLRTLRMDGGDRARRTAIGRQRQSSQLQDCLRKQKGRQIALPPFGSLGKKTYFRLVMRGQVSRELGDEGRAAPVGADAGWIDRVAVPAAVVGGEVAGEGVAIALRQVGVGVAQVEGEHLVGEADADVPGVVVGVVDAATAETDR